MTTSNLEPDLQRDEGNRLESYLDTRGNWTIGVGHLLGTAPSYKGLIWTQDQVDLQFAADVQTAKDSLNTYLPWWTSLDDLRQDCMVNMTFNMGIHTLTKFNTFLGYMQSEDYASAASDLEGTAWYRQVGDRAVRIKDQIATGVHQD